jgi:hypothetical protein
MYRNVCKCPEGGHAIEPSGDVYLCQPDGCGQTMDVFYCASGCDRMMCTASEANYSAHCCKRCAETQGKDHSIACTENWAWMSMRIRQKAAA